MARPFVRLTGLFLLLLGGVGADSAPTGEPPKISKIILVEDLPTADKPVRATLVTGTMVSLFSSDDYPPTAIRNNDEGMTHGLADVSPEGKVVGCHILESSGSTTLDEATCRIVSARAQYKPARDAMGRAVADTNSFRIKWVLPSEPFAPTGGTIVIDFTPSGPAGRCVAPVGRDCTEGESLAKAAIGAAGNKPAGSKIQVLSTFEPIGASSTVPMLSSRYGPLRQTVVELAIDPRGRVVECKELPSVAPMTQNACRMSQDMHYEKVPAGNPVRHAIWRVAVLFEPAPPPPGVTLDVSRDGAGHATACKMVKPVGDVGLEAKLCDEAYGDIGERTPTFPLVSRPTTPTPPPAESGPKLTNMAEVVSLVSLPKAALDADEDGIAFVRVEVDAAGRPRSCEIAVSSGSKALDSATCTRVLAAGRFEPAPAYRSGKRTAVAQIEWELHPGEPELTNLPQVFTANDYPVDAIRAEQQGTVRTLVTVDSGGHPTGCEIRNSSGAASLDSAACRLITTRGRYPPSSDSRKRTAHLVVRWVLPEFNGSPLAGANTKFGDVRQHVRFTLDANGVPGPCQVFMSEEEVDAPSLCKAARPFALGATHDLGSKGAALANKEIFVDAGTLIGGEEAAKSIGTAPGDKVYGWIVILISIDPDGKIVGCEPLPAMRAGGSPWRMCRWAEKHQL